MDCKTAQNLISAAVDGELDPKTMNEFLQAIELCEDCKAEFLAQKETKALIQAKLKYMKAPQSLIDGIKRQIAEKANTSNQTPKDSFSKKIKEPKFSSSNKEKKQVENIIVRKYSNVDINENTSGEAILSGQYAFSNDTSFGLKNKISEWLFINPNLNNRYNTYFATGLAVTVLAMLLFAAFSRNHQAVLIDNTSVSIESTPNIYELTKQAFSQTVLHRPDLMTDEPQVIENFLTKHLRTYTPVPIVKGFLPHSVRLTAFKEINAGEITYVDEKNKNHIIVYVISSLDDHHNLLIPSEIRELISTDHRYFYSSNESGKSGIVIWQWGNAVYSATSEKENHDLTSLVRNPNW
ncbi:MAG: zf-HC2 domain-containing protein [Chloroherpetonaceae bacterium]|nr:zf-HC2 domain-containing protein [Chloroherpetonaceae bacterium]